MFHNCTKIKIDLIAFRVQVGFGLKYFGFHMNVVGFGSGCRTMKLSLSGSIRVVGQRKIFISFELGCGLIWNRIFVSAQDSTSIKKGTKQLNFYAAQIFIFTRLTYEYFSCNFRRATASTNLKSSTNEEHYHKCRQCVLDIDILTF